MPHDHSITRKQHFKHLTPFQRGQIQAFMKQKVPKAQIARILGIARSTLYYELKRGTVEQLDCNLNVKHVYFADTGQLVYDERRKNSKKPIYIHAAHDFLRHVEREIKEKNYPQMLYEAKRQNLKGFQSSSLQKRFITIFQNDLLM